MNTPASRALGLSDRSKDSNSRTDIYGAFAKELLRRTTSDPDIPLKYHIKNLNDDYASKIPDIRERGFWDKVLVGYQQIHKTAFGTSGPQREYGVHYKDENDYPSKR